MKELTDEQIAEVTRDGGQNYGKYALKLARAAIAADRALNAPEHLVKMNSEFIRVRAQLEREWVELKALKNAEKNTARADRDVMRQAVTEEMAAAYLTASNRYWRETDKWRNGTALEAARVSLEAALAAAPTPPAEQPAKVETTYARQHAAHEAELTALIQERDHREEIIDNLCDAVLGPDRAEWSSNYYFEDAVSEVQERITELETRKECRESNAAAEQGEQEPAPDVLATLRAKVEGQTALWHYGRPTLDRASVLALIDKMGGAV